MAAADGRPYSPPRHLDMVPEISVCRDMRQWLPLRRWWSLVATSCTSSVRLQPGCGGAYGRCVVTVPTCLVWLTAVRGFPRGVASRGCMASSDVVYELSLSGGLAWYNACWGLKPNDRMLFLLCSIWVYSCFLLLVALLFCSFQK
jgi:hypothetical protein